MLVINFALETVRMCSTYRRFHLLHIFLYKVYIEMFALDHLLSWIAMERRVLSSIEMDLKNFVRLLWFLLLPFRIFTIIRHTDFRYIKHRSHGSLSCLGTSQRRWTSPATELPWKQTRRNSRLSTPRLSSRCQIEWSTGSSHLSVTLCRTMEEWTHTVTTCEVSTCSQSTQW